MYNYKRNDYIDNHVSTNKLDLDFNFKTHPITDDISKIKNIEAIKSSIKILVLLNHYEKPFHPDIGCDIYKSLFELMDDPANEIILKDYIIDVIDKYEPRAELKDIIINFQEDNNNIEIIIYFTPINSTDTISMNLYLKIIR